MNNSVKIALLCVAAVILVWAVAGAPMPGPSAQKEAVIAKVETNPRAATTPKATEDTQFAHEEKQYND